MPYSITINSSAAARALAAQSGYNFVFAKGVSTGDGVDYNTAWFVLNPSEIGDSTTVSWDASSYVGSYTNEMPNNGANIEVDGNATPLQTGGYYQVDSSGTFGQDPNRPANPSRPAFHFLNNTGYPEAYTPVLLTQDDTGSTVPFWFADTGVTRNGAVSALPVEMVRVWLGRYDAGTAVLADYSTQPVEFDLTQILTATATINDDLSGWTRLSPNARPVDNTPLLLAATSASKPVPSCHRFRREDSARVQYLTLPPIVAVTAAFSRPLTMASVSYLATKLLSLIPPGLGTKALRVSASSLEVKFSSANTSPQALGINVYEEAVNSALEAAKRDPQSQMGGEYWTLTETTVNIQL